ncbi:MAG: tetratricopeptide repeat protein [Pseudomonadota bacterium]
MMQVMTIIYRRFKHPVAAFALAVCISAATHAQEQDLDDLFDALQSAEAQAAEAIEARIWEEWSKTGSPAMDLLLNRGREAMEAGEIETAIEHFTALVDHAPEFAEGYNARATAYFQAGLYGPSLEDIRQVLARNPRHFGAMSGLAVILEDLGESAGALDAYRAVEEIYPAREGLGEAIRRLEREIEGEDI